MDLIEAGRCSCCGQQSHLAHDPELANRWQPVVVECYSSQAIAQFREEHGDAIEPHMLIGVRLLDEGEEVRDPLAYDADEALSEYAAHLERIKSL